MSRAEVELIVAVDADAAARTAAERLAAQARAGGHIVLTGGTTPRRAYELAAGLEPDWSAVELWWTDERCVPTDDERSNYGLVQTTLLERLAAGPKSVHRIEGELGRDEGAERYEHELHDVERFDLILLGLGPDGHVASLFPDAPTLDETRRRALGAEARLAPFVDRITLTLPVLNGAREVLFLVAGADKADAVRRAFGEDPSRATPGSLVRAGDGTTAAVLDPAAAAKL